MGNRDDCWASPSSSLWMRASEAQVMPSLSAIAWMRSRDAAMAAARAALVSDAFMAEFPS